MRRAVWAFSLSRKVAVEQNYNPSLSREKTKLCITGDELAPQLSIHVVQTESYGEEVARTSKSLTHFLSPEIGGP